MSTISASTTSTTAYKVTADTTGTLVLQTGSTPTTAVTIDTAQNVGLGVTPSAWDTFKALDVNTYTSLFSSTGSSQLSGNLYYASGAYRYKTTAAASVYVQTAGSHQWFNAPSGTAGTAATTTQAMTLDASGQLLIGATSGSYPLVVKKAASSSDTSSIQIMSGTAGYAQLLFGNTGSDAPGYLAYNNSSNFLAIATNGSERARIDSSGNLLVGKTVQDNTTVGTYIQGNGHIGIAATSSTNVDNSYVMYSTGAAAYRFYVDFGGTIHATSTTITAISSDQRLKQDIVDYDKGLTEVLALRPRSFAYKAEPDRKLAGFISQEVQTVMPDAIEPTLENPEMLTYAIDWYPLLVKAIQEQQAMIASQSELITTLTERITALEGAK